MIGLDAERAKRYQYAVVSVLTKTEAYHRRFFKKERLINGVPFRFINRPVDGPQCVTLTLQIRDEDLDNVLKVGDRLAMAAQSQFCRVYRDLGLIRAEFTLPRNEWKEVKLVNLTHRRDSATVGQAALGPVVRTDWSTPHKAIFGTSQSGKTTCLTDIILSLAKTHTPDDYRFLILNPKNDEKFKPFRRLAHLAGRMANGYDDSANLLRFALAEMERRRQDAGRTKQRLVVIVDEIAQLTEINPEVGPMITQLSQMAGGLNINLVVASQAANPRVFGKSGSLAKANFPSRLVFQLPNEQAYMATGVKGQDTVRLGGDGDGLAVVEGGQVTRFRAAWPTERDFEGLDMLEVEPESPDDGDLAGDQAIMAEDNEEYLDRLAFAVTFNRKNKFVASATAIREQFNIGTPKAMQIRDEAEFFKRRVMVWYKTKKAEGIV